MGDVCGPDRACGAPPRGLLTGGRAALPLVPQENTLEDGWLTTAPARAFAPNGYGLHPAPDASMGDAGFRTVSLRTENA